MFVVIEVETAAIRAVFNRRVSCRPSSSCGDDSLGIDNARRGNACAHDRRLAAGAASAAARHSFG
jgi:hypothetical protein